MMTITRSSFSESSGTSRVNTSVASPVVSGLLQLPDSKRIGIAKFGIYGTSVTAKAGRDLVVSFGGCAFVPVRDESSVSMLVGVVSKLCLREEMARRLVDSYSAELEIFVLDGVDSTQSVVNFDTQDRVYRRLDIPLSARGILCVNVQPDAAILSSAVVSIQAMREGVSTSIGSPSPSDWLRGWGTSFDDTATVRVGLSLSALDQVTMAGYA